MSLLPRHRREWLLRTLLYVLLLLLLAFQIRIAQLSADKRLGLMIEDVPVLISELVPEGPAQRAGLAVGDILVRINTTDIVKSLDYDEAAKSFERDLPAHFTIRRDDQPLEFEVVPGMAVDWISPLLNVGIAIVCLLMGALALKKRPGSLPSALVNRLFMLLAAEVALPEFSIGLPVVAAISTATFYLVIGAQAATDLHIVSLIPVRRKWIVRRPWLVPAFYVIGLGVGALTALTFVIEDVFKKDLFPWSSGALEAFTNGPFLFAWASAVAVILIVGMVTYSTARQRRLTAIVLAGTGPWVLYVYITTFLSLSWVNIPIPYMVGELWSLILLPFPASIFVMLRMEDRVRNGILRDLIQGVQAAGSMAKVSELISNDLNLAFHTKCNYVFFREQRDSEMTSVHTSGAQLHVERIPNDYEILKAAEREGRTLAYDENLHAVLPEEERDWLDLLEANLIVPLIESDAHMAGLLILGQKRSEEPYTPDDLQLLSALASQITLAYENLKLQLQVQQNERVQREVLDQLEAQDVNLTQECPICGFCFDSKEKICPRDETKLALTLPVERVINGRYRLEQVLGRGGVAVVYLATDLSLDRGVAIKVLARTILDDVHAPRRFEREARVAARLIHPHIVTTLDFGKTRNDLPFIVMEYLEGRTLRQVLKQEKDFDAEVVATWFEDILDGLAAAHGFGVVHRDLKPDNIYLVGYPAGPGSVKLLDFGLAKVQSHASSEETRLTSPGTIMGTLAYMAPEQLSGLDEIDLRTDIYSIGVMVYEAVLGRRPYSGRNPTQLLNAIGQNNFRFPDLPEAHRLRHVLERCLASKRRARYPSVVELKKDLLPALRVCPSLRG
jgi:hypothetical protein